jgi:hypothetical protein
MSAQNPEAADDYSNPRAAGRGVAGPLGLLGSALAALALAGILLAVVATFSTVIKVQLQTVTAAHYTGFDRHSVALILLALFALMMLVGGLRGSRPALLAVGLVGLVILLIAVIFDLPHLNDSGVWPQSDLYEDAQASAGAGYYLETASGVLLLLSGVSLAALAPGREGRERRPRRAPAAEAAATERPPAKGSRAADDWFAEDA